MLMANLLARFGGRRRLAVALLLLLTACLLVASFAFTRPSNNRPKPVLRLMTSLPLMWSEGGIEADLSPDAAPHPAFVHLSKQYDVQPIDDLRILPAKPRQMLLLAQPRALQPSELMRLDEWVRAGGHVVIMADPALQWGSLYPLGDKRRPLFTSMLSPLLTHWGLELVLPMADEKPVAIRRIGPYNIRTQTPGEWLPKAGNSNPRCAISAQGMLADCRVGKGRALLVADADMLDTRYWEGQGMRMITGGDEFAKMDWIKSLLAALQSGKSVRGDFVGK
jgi:hypothetical protein